MLVLRNESYPLVQTLVNMTFGWINDCNSAEHAYIYNLMKDNMKLINNNLKGKEWLAGTNEPSVADI